MANEKMGFYFDQKSCIGCRTCQAACKDKNDLPLGILFRSVRDFEVGNFPNVGTYHYAGTCNHCMNPACVAGCPSGAMYVDEADGTVQHDYSKCIDCQYCVENCPYGVPQFIEDLGVVHKCDACKTLRANGEQPACVASCPMRALEFDTYENLLAAHPDAVLDIVVLPSSETTDPCRLINAKDIALSGEPLEFRL